MFKVGNDTKDIVFTVLCFSDKKEVEIPLSIVFLIIFHIIIIGNITVFATITLCSQLYTPMYMFLGSLSFLDISYALTTLPKLLLMLSTQEKTISFVGCMIQLYFFIAFVCIEFILLAVMAYDRYVAICHPLHYSLLMTVQKCAKLITSVWIIGFLDPVAHVLLISKMSFCSTHNIDYFFCDYTPVLKITCSDTSAIEILTYVNGVFVAITSFTLTTVSYVFIIYTILKIRTSKGRQKAFSTCASHLTCVIIVYFTISCSYMRPTKIYNPKQEKYFALLYNVLVRMLNPFIYTIKNKEFKDVLRKTAIKKLLSM